jgi:hypothetical protein
MVEATLFESFEKRFLLLEGFEVFLLLTEFLLFGALKTAETFPIIGTTETRRGLMVIF